MKIEALRRIRVGKAAKGEARSVPREGTADVEQEVGEDLIKRGLAKVSAGRPSGGGQGGGNGKPKAEELIAEITASEDVDRIREIAKDGRKTVVDAAEKRVADLQEAEKAKAIEEIGKAEDLEQLGELAGNDDSDVAHAAVDRIQALAKDGREDVANAAADLISRLGANG